MDDDLYRDEVSSDDEDAYDHDRNELFDSDSGDSREDTIMDDSGKSPAQLTRVRAYLVLCLISTCSKPAPIT